MNRTPWLKAFCSSIYLFLYLPMAVMMAFSFNNSRRNVVWQGFTVKWYGKLLENRDLLSSFTVSLEIALVVTVVSVVVALLAGYALVRHASFKGRGGYAGIMNVPMMLPEIVLGVGLLMWFVRAGIRLSFLTVACSHVVFCLPYAAASIRARLMSLRNASFEEAAMDLGASEWQAFRKVTLPLLKPALISAALLAFTTSFEDFVVSFFVSGIGSVTLPVRIYSMMKFGISPEINALATLMLLATLTFIAGYYWFGESDH